MLCHLEVDLDLAPTQYVFFPILKNQCGEDGALRKCISTCLMEYILGNMEIYTDTDKHMI